jgi:hypothetical protein
MVEVLELANIKNTPASLVILDEIGRGTSRGRVRDCPAVVEFCTGRRLGPGPSLRPLPRLIDLEGAHKRVKNFTSP